MLSDILFTVASLNMWDLSLWIGAPPKVGSEKFIKDKFLLLLPNRTV